MFLALSHRFHHRELNCNKLINFALTCSSSSNCGSPKHSNLTVNYETLQLWCGSAFQINRLNCASNLFLSFCFAEQKLPLYSSTIKLLSFPPSNWKWGNNEWDSSAELLFWEELRWKRINLIFSAAFRFTKRDPISWAFQASPQSQSVR